LGVSGVSFLVLAGCCPVPDGRAYVQTSNYGEEAIHRMPGIRVKEGESFESALRRFKKKCEKAGVLADLRRHQHFEKPSERRKRKLNAAKRKMMARMKAE
jgi:small subunit ribosomal protein S21